MQPLRRAWAAARQAIEALHDQWQPLAGNARRKLMGVAEGVLLDVMEQLAQVRVLDPSCGYAFGF